MLPRLASALPILLLALGASSAGCGDDAREHADWSQLSFPEDVAVADPVEVPNGVVTGFEKFAVVTSSRDLDPKQLTRELRLALEADGWGISQRGDIRPGFGIDAPDSTDDGEVAPLRQLERFVHGYRGRVGELIDATPGSSDGVLVRLGATVAEPEE